VVKSEALKAVTLPSTAVVVALTVVAALLVTGLVSRAALHHSPAFYVGFDPTQESLTGLVVAALTGGVLGALLITGEYSSGSIHSTIAATPRRPVLLIAKLGVTAIAAVVFCELLSLVSFFVGQAILAGGGAPSASLASPGASRAVAMTGVFVALMALMSFGFGLLMTSTAGAIGAFAGVVFVLPLVMYGISEPDLRFVPSIILENSIMATVRQTPASTGVVLPLSPVTGLLLMAGYTVLALALGSVLFVRRDA
jgi:ABC-type transport system involved in multi-copper enzyme maturation permease subunit